MLGWPPDNITSPSALRPMRLPEGMGKSPAGQLTDARCPIPRAVATTLGAWGQVFGYLVGGFAKPRRANHHASVRPAEAAPCRC